MILLRRFHSIDWLNMSTNLSDGAKLITVHKSNLNSILLKCLLQIWSNSLPIEVNRVLMDDIKGIKLDLGEY